MDQMEYTDWWKKLPNGWDWRREPSSLRVIGLRGANTREEPSETPKMTPRTEEGPLGLTKTTSVLLGSTKTTSVSIGSTNTTLGSTGSSNTNLGSARSTSGLFGVPQATSGFDGTLKTPLGLVEKLQGTSRTLQTASGLLGRLKPTSEALGTTKTTVGQLDTTAPTFGMNPRMERMFQTTAVLLGRMSETSRVTQRTTKAAHTPIINHIIMLCGFKDDSVMVECINQKEWTTLNDVISIGINGPNTFHTVKSDGATFKARPLSGDIRMLKGFLTYFKRMSDTEARLLDEDDIHSNGF
jgi:hypothetical protein